jgi:hypothetical protein
MPDPIEAFSTLDDFLLSLADGIARAQEELTRSGLQGQPGQQFTYHLPRVDFELKMNVRVVEDANLSSRYKTLHPARIGDKHLLFRPMASEESSTLDIAAVVRGAFVAVPANNGLPPPVITVSVDAADPDAPEVRVVARNAAGEALVGVSVEFNVDRDESEAISAAAGTTMEVAADTRFEQASVNTDIEGIATSVLRVGSSQQTGLLAIVIDVAGRTETLVYEVTS